jgi:ubiquinone/menaquinone biosynthesis C-methylase UbiE
MRFEYRETPEDLATRIDIHRKYGARDIDAWMIQLLQPAPGSRILDVGCGAGKQLQAFYDAVDGNAEIVGGDISDELLAQARALSQRLGGSIRVERLDFDSAFPFPDARFDLVSSCFAIYYTRDVGFTIGQMHRVLVGGGRLFLTGPMPTNKQLFYDIVREATGKPIPPMPGSSRYSTEILGEVRRRFPSVELQVFENPLSFEQVEPFVEYTRASLSEDRKLWRGLFQDANGFEGVMQSIARVAEKRLAESGPLVMTKVVGGIVAVK